MTAQLYLDGAERNITATFTATRSRHSDNVSVFDTNRNGVLLSSASSLSATTPTVIEFYFRIDNFHAEGNGLVAFRNVIDLYRSNATSTLHVRHTMLNTNDDTGIPILQNTQYGCRLEWDGAGAYTVSVFRNSSFASFTGSANTASTSAPSPVRSHGSTFTGLFLDGAVWGLAKYENGALTNYWPMTDGSGSTPVDVFAGANMSFSVRAGGYSVDNTSWNNRTWLYAFNNQEYTIPLKLKDYDRGSHWIGVEHQSLAGNYRRTNHRIETRYQCTTVPLGFEDARWMRCFLDSCIAGEQFTITDHGLGIGCTMESTSYTEQREARRGDGGAGDYFVFSWNHRAI